MYNILVVATASMIALAIKGRMEIKREMNLKSPFVIEDTPYQEKINGIGLNVNLPPMVRNVTSKIERSFSKDKLNTFYHNVHTLRVTDDVKKLSVAERRKGIRLMGVYLPMENAISIDETCVNEKIVAHELLHMSSCKRRRNKYFQGFCQGNKNNNVGDGLNEGYTEVLTRRYFDNGNFSKGAYTTEQFFALCVEKLVGRDKMEKYYFDADLKGLMRELQNYYSDREIESFIVGLDNIFNYKSTRNKELRVEEIVRNSYVEVASFAHKALLINSLNNRDNKAVRDYQNGTRLIAKIGDNILSEASFQSAANELNKRFTDEANEILRSKVYRR